MTERTVWISYSGTVHADQDCSVLRPRRGGQTKPYEGNRDKAHRDVEAGELKDCRKCGGSK